MKDRYIAARAAHSVGTAAIHPKASPDNGWPWMELL
jgi:hypothetical protein